MSHTLDATTVRTWCALALEALGRDREGIDAINVYPVADGDTGTNLYFTVESAARAVDAVFTGHAAMDGGAAPALPDALRAMAHGALIGARGNSGTILAQLLRGMAEALAAEPADTESLSPSSASPPLPAPPVPGAAPAVRTAAPGGYGSAERLRRALRRAAESARQAVARPVEGTVLTVAAAAADAADSAEDSAEAVVRAAYEGARVALAATREQLAVLDRAGVVDAGGCGLVVVLGALVHAVCGEPPDSGAPPAVPRPAVTPAAEAPGCDLPAEASGGEGPDFEVIYLLEAPDDAVGKLRTRLDALGDSLVVVGGDGLWNVHVHVHDAGAAVEAGIEAGRPYRIGITHFGAAAAARHEPAERAQRAVVAVVPGDGLAGLHREAGATVVTARPGEPPAAGELVQAVRRAHAREVVLLPNDTALRHTAAAAAEQARTEGVRVALIPTRSVVQGIAALAVHEPGRRFDEDVVAMTSAAGATRCAELVIAEHRSWTMAGVCQAGDVLGLIDGDVAVIGGELAGTAVTVLDRMLAAGGEMVTLVLGEDAPDTLADRLEAHVRGGHLAVDTVVYRGGQGGVPLIIGVE